MASLTDGERQKGTLARTVEFEVKCASNLPPTDEFVTKPDPYCVVSVGKIQKRSATNRSNLDPSWDFKEKISVMCDPREEVLTIEVYGHNIITADVFMGAFELPLCSIIKKEYDVCDAGVLLRGRKATAHESKLHFKAKIFAAA